jgi:hypothetical protein
MRFRCPHRVLTRHLDIRHKPHYFRHMARTNEDTDNASLPATDPKHVNGKNFRRKRRTSVDNQLTGRY